MTWQFFGKEIQGRELALSSSFELERTQIQLHRASTKKKRKKGRHRFEMLRVQNVERTESCEIAVFLFLFLFFGCNMHQLCFSIT
jgi:hypothetical protein